MELGMESKVGIVTGGGRGIGAEIAMALGKEGVDVVIAEVMTDAAEEVAGKIRSLGVRSLVIKTDVSQKADADNLAARTIKEFGRIDILVNNAGVVLDASFLETQEPDWDRLFSINVKGVYLVTRAVVPHMMAARSGKIINIASRGGKEGQALLACYCATKFAVVGLTQAMAKEFAEYNINVNDVCPGLLWTEMMKQRMDARSQKQGLPPEDIYQKLVEGIPLKRPQTPEDVAKAVIFLCSDMAVNITGESLNVTGGLRMD
jgi:meso-butanediol dehydrogenase / (S,S)-butanediol dehydrogenase / diacetyl reductase